MVLSCRGSYLPQHFSFNSLSPSAPDDNRNVRASGTLNFDSMVVHVFRFMWSSVTDPDAGIRHRLMGSISYS